ncbi:hypothetical protein Tco_0890374 [Tanacetum coccineum]|uniref:Uncharacterized protein n=1 Tax=Tanacetum coccineum TaxID=301880 RepID=A0ABQ5C260_9ASTR
MKGLSECKAPESNIRHIRVKNIIKEVKDYLKTYSSAGMDISCWLYKFACKLDTLSSLLVTTRMVKSESEQLLSADYTVSVFSITYVQMLH